VIDDAAKFIAEEGHDSYDVIIVDSSDQVGPAEALFAPPFFKALSTALNPGGIICTQVATTPLPTTTTRHRFFWSYSAIIDALTDHLYPTPTYPTSQAECQWLHLDLISNVVQANCHIFPTVEYAFTTISTYPSGQIGFMLLSNSTAGK